jgi:TolA-binding protein
MEVDTHIQALRQAGQILRSKGVQIGLLTVLLSWGGPACTVDSSKNRYLLAERLWSDGKYAAAVSEFDKVAARDPQSKLGRQAMFRSAMTESLYLSNYSEAIRKFRNYIEVTGNTPLAWESYKQIGEILFSKTEQYDRAIQHYRNLLAIKPKAEEAPEFLFRIGRSHFFLRQFDKSISVYREITSKYSKSPWAERALFETAVSFYTQGGQHNPGNPKSGTSEGYQEAIDGYERFLKKFPKSDLAVEARFGIAACLEELDQLEAAYHTFEALKTSYPSPSVIEIRLARIRERRQQKSH